jgi:hypothetical protein
MLAQMANHILFRFFFTKKRRFIFKFSDMRQLYSLLGFLSSTRHCVYDWFIHNGYFIYAAQAGARKFAETFKEFPAIQKPNTFTIDDAIAKMSEAGGGGSH